MHTITQSHTTNTHLVGLGIQDLDVVLLQEVLVTGVRQDVAQHTLTLLDAGGADEHRPACVR